MLLKREVNSLKLNTNTCVPQDGSKGWLLCLKSNGQEDKIWPTDRLDNSQFINSHTTQQIHHTYIHVRACLHAQSFQSCLTLCNPMDCNPPASFHYGISHARMLEWAAMPTSRGLSQPGDQTHVYLHLLNHRWILYTVNHLESIYVYLYICFKMGYIWATIYT